MSKRILILCGGQSDEHEISLISAKCILEALDRSRFEPIIAGISRQGTWFLEREENFYVGEPRADQIKLNTNAPMLSIAPYPTPQGRGRLLADGKTVEFDIAFPVLHGPYGEDGTLQGLFDLMHIPYVGATCGSSWICMDKALTKILCTHHDIPTADFVQISSVPELIAKTAAVSRLGLPLFVKPNRLGSSVGVTKVSDASLLETAVNEALRVGSTCLIEKAIDAREIEVAVLGLNHSPRAAKPGEIVPSKKVGFYSYEAKYLMEDGAELLFPAPLDASVTGEVQALALKVFRVLGCDGMARIDLFLERKTGKVWLNEANTIPGFTPISMFPKLWQISGLEYKELLTELIRLALARLGKGF